MAIKKLPSTGDAPRSTGVPESLQAGGTTDSAGLPWEGRTFDHHGTDFADDDGETPQALRVAVDDLRAAASALTHAASLAERDTALDGLVKRHTQAVAALAESRVLVPLVAEAGDYGETEDGRIVEKSQELSIVTVSGPDGRRVMPVFSSTAAMRHWNPEARPIPVPVPQAALAAIQENTQLIIVDPGTADRELGVRRPALRAIVEQRPTTPAWADPEVEEAVRVGAAEETSIRFTLTVPGDPEARLLAAETDVIVGVAPGLESEQLNAVISRVQARWSQSPIIAERVDSMRVRIVPDEG